jgi:flagellar biosynthesis protein FliR
MDQALRSIGSGDLSAALLLLALCAARVVPVLVLAPFLGGRLVPATVKVGLAVAVALLVWPQALRGVALPQLGTVHVVLLLAKEAFVGVALGLCAALVFMAAEAAGRLIDTARGASLAESLVPQSGTRASPVADLYLQLAVVVFLALGGHRLFLAALARSYEVIPVTSFPSTTGLGALALATIAMTGQMLFVAVGLATPVLLAAVLTDVALGLVNRVAPQLNAFVLGMPAKALVGAALVLVTLSLVAGEVAEGGALRDTARVVEALGR